MGCEDDVYSLILYKQHYRDNYDGKSALPDDVFSSFGYYDGFKVEIENTTESGSNSNFIETLYDKTHDPIKNLGGRYGVQIVGIFRAVSDENSNIKTKEFIEDYNDNLCAAVGFAQISEAYDIQADAGLNKLIEKIEQCSTKSNIMAMATFDNADLIILVKGSELYEINKIMKCVDELDEVSYMHTITGISQEYLNECQKNGRFLEEWNSKKVCLDNRVVEFNMRIATKNKADAIAALQNIVKTKCDMMNIDEDDYIRKSIAKCKKLCIYGHHDIELTFKNAPMKFVLFSMLPESILSHDNHMFGKSFYNIESGYKYKAKIVKTTENQETNETNGNASQKSKIITLMKQISKELWDELAKDPVIQALYNSLNTIAQFEDFQLANDIFYLVFPAISGFLDHYLEYYSQIKVQKTNVSGTEEDKIRKDEDEKHEYVSGMVEYINSIIQHSVHTDQMFLMIPGYCGSSFGLSTKLLLFYQWMAYKVMDLLKADGNKYDILLSPEAEVKPLTKEMRFGIDKHTIIVRFGQKMLFQPQFCIILIHELAHYVGEIERKRSCRTQLCVKLTARLMTEILFRDVRHQQTRNSGSCNVLSYRQRVYENIAEYTKSSIDKEYPEDKKEYLYASELEKILRDVVLKIISVDDGDPFFKKIFLAEDEAFEAIGCGSIKSKSQKIKVIQIYCETINKIRQNCKECLFDGTMDSVISNLITTFKEIYSDVCAYNILGFEFDEFVDSFEVSENRKIAEKNVSPMQGIRQFVMNSIINEDKEYHIEALELKDTDLFEQMFSFEYVQEALIRYAKECHLKLSSKLRDSDRRDTITKIQNAHMALKGDNIFELYEEVLKDIYSYKQNV